MVAALDDVVEAGDLVGDVVDAGAVGAVAEQHGVLVVVARCLHEDAHGLDDVGGPEAEPVGVEGDGFLAARLDDVQRDMAHAQREGPGERFQRGVPAVDAAERVGGAGGDVGVLRAGQGEADAEAALVDGVEDAVGALVDRAVAVQLGDEPGEFLPGVDAPDDLAEGGPGLQRRGQQGAGHGVQVQGLPGQGLEDRVLVGPLHQEQPEVVEETDAFGYVVDPVGDGFDSLDSHGCLVSRVARRA